MAFEFTPSEEQRMLVDTVRRFMAQEIFPHEREVERLAEVPLDRGRQIQMRTIAGDPTQWPSSSPRRWRLG
jgi:acyl-CoA dehydrogenase